MCAKLLQSCLTFCNPMDCSLPGSSIHGILQARILEWVTMTCSWGSSLPRDRTHVSYVSCIGRRVLYHECHLGPPGCCLLLLHMFCLFVLATLSGLWDLSPPVRDQNHALKREFTGSEPLDNREFPAIIVYNKYITILA